MNRALFLLIFLVFACFLPGAVFASEGTIDSVYKYGWSDEIGWVNFGNSYGNVTINDTTITGYAWNDNYGWINLAPTYGGVTNTTGGNVGGYAWGQNTGWINFDNVAIGCSGQFSGTATGDVIGTINFECTNCRVVTNWQKAGCGGDGGGPPPPPTHLECNAQQQCVSVSGAGNNQCASNNDCTPPPPPPPAQCSDGIDNDNDGATDYPNDFSCSSATDNDETNPKAQCQDGIDNDGDGLTDYPQDPGCSSKQDNDESNQTSYQCSDGTDNDNDGATDYPNDFSCSSATDNDETNPKAECQDGIDNDGDGFIDYPSDTGCASKQDDNETNSATLQCQDGIDNDGDGATDYPDDFSCSSATDNDETNPKAQCQDGIDNDNDSLIDYPSDTGCLSKQDDNETNAGATHRECSNLQCVIVNGAGTNQCATNNDCTTPVHNECNSQKQCVSVAGTGGNQCQTNNDCNGPPTVYQHNECNSQQQCIVVGGIGSDQCQTDTNCKRPVIILPPPDEIIKIIGNIIPSIIPRTIIKAVETPIGSVTSKIASTTGVVITATAITTGILAYPVSLLEVFLTLARLFSFLLLAFGIKRRARPWGVVYDSITKQPIDPVYVTLKNIQTGKTQSAITDIDGRYGFLAEPGIYAVVASKTNYAFPSQKLAGKVKDELYDNLYFGGQIEIKKEGGVIIKNIPLDPLKFDWNEFAKKDKVLMKFYSRWDLSLRRISDAFFIVGFIVAIVVFFVAPYPYNTIVLGLYLFLLLLRVLGIKPKPLGYVTDAATGLPLSFAIIRVMLPDSNIEISHRVTDKYGRYYCLIPKGSYYVKIESKNSDGSYSLVYISPIVDASKSGIIKKVFKI